MPAKRKSKRMNGGCDSCPNSASLKGDGAKLQALARAAKTAGRVIKKGAQLAVKHRKDIAKAVAAGADIAGLIKPGDKVAGTVSGVANILGRGKAAEMRSLTEKVERKRLIAIKDPIRPAKLSREINMDKAAMRLSGRGGSATVQAIPTAFYPNSALLATGRPQF